MKLLQIITAEILLVMCLTGCSHDPLAVTSEISVSEKNPAHNGSLPVTDVSVPVCMSDVSKNENSDNTETREVKKMCDLMEEQLKKSNYNSNDINNCSQLLIIDSSDSSCSVYCFEKDVDGYWTTYMSSPGIVGINGVSKDSREGETYTPEGMFSLGTAFGTEEMSGLNIEYRKISQNSYWIDDSDSPLYNRWVESADINWKSAEHLIDYPDCYHYAVVINYNMSPIIPGKGSAIFLHCAVGEYTEGCVAVPEKEMLNILTWLDSSLDPYIIIS